MQHAQDRELVRRAMYGDEEARTRIAARIERVLRQRVERGACRRGTTAADRDDVLQDTLVAVWRKLAEYRGEATLETWATRFFRIEIARWRDRCWRRREVSLDSSSEEIPEHEWERDQERAVIALDHELRRVGRRTAHILRSKLVDEQTFGEIAEVVGTSVSGVKSIYYRGLAELKDLLTSHDRGVGGGVL